MSRTLRFLTLLALYTGVALVSYGVAWRVRFGFYPGLDGIPEQFEGSVLGQALYIIPFKLVCLYAAGQFSGLIRYFRLPDAIRLFLGSSAASFILLAVWVLSSYLYVPSGLVPPGAVLLIDYILFTFGLLGFRVGVRLIDEKRKGFLNRGNRLQRVAIVGAGDTGSALASELLSRGDLRMRPVLFFDDAPEKHGTHLHGIPIVGSPDGIPSFFDTHDLDKVVLAIPQARPERVRQLVSTLTQRQIPVETVPSTHAIISGHYRSNLTRKVRIEDLLYREPVRLDWDRIARTVTGKTVWVTGAGGSIGGEIATQLSGMELRRLVLVDHSEGALFLTEKSLVDRGCAVPITTVVADIADESGMNRLFEEHPPDQIYHAAAYKHVHMMQRQPAVALRNNALATVRLAQLAIQWKVASFCFISTDKAVAPSSVMGASKRLAEMGLQSLIEAGACGETSFIVVRFGNVLGSSGSVIPIFERQIEEGGPVTITDKAMRRYFMTIPEAVGLVLQAVSFEEKNRFYSLDMGEPVSIDAMARDLIRLKGLVPEEDIQIVYTGMRDGEKLSEVVFAEDETTSPTEHPKILRIAPQALGRAAEFDAVLEGLLSAGQTLTADAILLAVSGKAAEGAVPAGRGSDA